MAAGVPQAHDFRLVFVGREGWLVDALAEELRALGADPRNHLVWLSGVSDEALDRLYQHAAFCAYPSIYEGFGLPVVESFRYGKAVLASTGGAIPEAVGEFSPCLDPNDVAGWADALRAWIADPSARQPYERAIRERYQPRRWAEASAEFFTLIHRAFPALRDGAGSG
jgi:glycosyltransferase involved in cell wall biosynthesis